MESPSSQEIIALAKKNQVIGNREYLSIQPPLSSGDPVQWPGYSQIRASPNRMEMY